MRDEAPRLLDSVRETIAIGERAACRRRSRIHKIIGKANWGKSVDTLRLVDEARARGVDATIDQYPYTASSTSIARRCCRRGRSKAAASDAGAAEGPGDAREDQGRDGPRSSATSAAAAIRRTCSARAAVRSGARRQDASPTSRARGLEPTIENAAETALWIVEQGGCQGIFHAIGEEDLERILRHPATMIASDGEIADVRRGAPHPRSYGTFARVLGVRAREEDADARGRRAQDVGVSAQRLGLRRSRPAARA